MPLLLLCAEAHSISNLGSSSALDSAAVVSAWRPQFDASRVRASRPDAHALRVLRLPVLRNHNLGLPKMIGDIPPLSYLCAPLHVPQNATESRSAGSKREIQVCGRLRGFEAARSLDENRSYSRYWKQACHTSQQRRRQI